MSPNPALPTFGKYCKNQLIKFKPWVGEPSNAWDGAEESDEMFVNAYSDFLHTDFAMDRFRRYECERQSVEKWLEGDFSANDQPDNAGGNDEEDEEVYRPPEEFIDWMLLCRLNQQYEQITGNESSV